MTTDRPEPSAATIPLIVQQSGTIPVINHIPAWAWRCQECGWLGTGLGSERSALSEGSNHLWTEHKIVPCRPGEHGDDHKWVEVMGTDSVEVCTRCGWEIGK